MTLPTPAKSWLITPNMGPYTSIASLLYNWKQTIKQNDGNPNGFTVVKSSGKVGGTTWTAGAADYWGTTSAIRAEGTGDGSNHAWIVLQKDAIASGFQVLIVFLQHTGGWETVCDCYVSPSAGFTGGTTTTRPTATDEINTSNYNIGTGVADPMWAGDATNLGTYPAYLNVLQSVDGECCRWIVWKNNYCVNFFAIDKLKNPASGYTIPWVCIGASVYYASSGGSDAHQAGYAPFLNNLRSASAWNQKTCIGQGGTRGYCFLTSEGFLQYSSSISAIGEIMTYGGDLDGGAYPMCPVGVYSISAPIRGRVGEVFDLWWGSTAASDGDTYPDDGSRLFSQVNDLIVYWGGAAAMVRA